MAAGAGTIRRIIGAVRVDAGDPRGETASRAWRLALARSAHDAIGLALEVADLRDGRLSLTELLDLPADRSLLAVLEGPGESLGFLAMSPDLLAAMIEAQTIGKVALQAPLPRRPTRTDAAMCAPVIDRALADLEAALAHASDLVWAGGFRYASFLEDARPLGLLLEDQPYRVLQAEVGVCDGARRGQVLLALPAEGRGRQPVRPDGLADPAVRAARDWSEALGAAVLGADVALEAVLGRLRLPLSSVMALSPDDVLPLGAAQLDQVLLEAPDGRVIATGKLGQNRGMCALRLTGFGSAEGTLEPGKPHGAPVMPQHQSGASADHSAIARSA